MEISGQITNQSLQSLMRFQLFVELSISFLSWYQSGDLKIFMASACWHVTVERIPLYV